MGGIAASVALPLAHASVLEILVCFEQHNGDALTRQQKRQDNACWTTPPAMQQSVLITVQL